MKNSFITDNKLGLNICLYDENIFRSFIFVGDHFLENIFQITHFPRNIRSLQLPITHMLEPLRPIYISPQGNIYLFLNLSIYITLSTWACLDKFMKNLLLCIINCIMLIRGKGIMKSKWSSKGYFFWGSIVPRDTKRARRGGKTVAAPGGWQCTLLRKVMM